MDQAEQSGKKWAIFSVVALICAAAVLVCVFLVVNHLRENYARYTPDQITGRIVAELNPPDLVKVEPDQISKHYDLPDGVVSESSLYMSKSPESASELACFLLSDPSKFEQLETAVTAHISAKAAGFKSLNPTQYNALKNVLISRSGRYVLVAVGSGTEAEEKLFLSLLAESS